MRKFKFFLLALVATVFLTGCGDDKGADKAAASNQADTIAKIKERGYVRIAFSVTNRHLATSIKTAKAKAMTSTLQNASQKTCLAMRARSNLS